MKPKVLSYRPDLLVVVGDCMWVDRRVFIVECDGHDFHDRTKQQAAYDRSRDRELLAAGIPTLRFTGSEIVHSVERCVDDVFAMVDRIRSDEADREAVIDYANYAGQIAARDRREVGDGCGAALVLGACG